MPGLFMSRSREVTSGDGNSCRLYVNGSEVTSFSTDTNPSTDDDLVLGSDRVHFVGISNYGASADRGNS